MSITEIFETMEYGNAPESDKDVRAWLAQNPRFGHFIGGACVEGKEHFSSLNPATGEKLAEIAKGDAETIETAVKAARLAQKSWAKLGGKRRARFLYAMARHIQKHARFLAVLETLDNGKPIRESRDADIPLAARHFYHHAGWAQLESEFEGYEPHGVIGQIIPWNFPFLMLAWKIAPALAAGNTVVLKPAEFTSLTALYFAKICQDIGLPKGVVNIVTGDGETGAALVGAEVDKLAFTGSTEVGKLIQSKVAPRGLPLTLELGGKSPFIVFEDADLDAVVEGVVSAIWFNQGEVCCAGSRLLVQESVAERLYAKLRARMGKLRVGDPLDKNTDIGALVDESQRSRIETLIKNGLKEGGNYYEAPIGLPNAGCFLRPALITGLGTAHSLTQEEIFGPVLVSLTFRTEKEAIALANNSRYGLAASIWSENLDQCLSTAPLINAGVVWINSHNLFDAAAEFGGVKESGFGREGSKNGMFDYLRPISSSRKINPLSVGVSERSEIDSTRKLFIGGKQARPDGGYSRGITGKDGILIDHVPIAKCKDLRNAVEAARASTWGKASGHNRAQVLYYLGENLEKRSDVYTKTLEAVMGKKAAQAEVELAIEHCFTFAAWADKNAGSLGDVPMRAALLSQNRPVGVIGMLASNGAPFAEPIRAITAALSMGNSVIINAPEDFPLAVLDIAALAETSDVPTGALNILSGDTSELGLEMAKHAGIEALWDFAGINEARAYASSNVKRLFTGDLATLPDRALLRAACEVKSIWLPFGALY